MSRLPNSDILVHRCEVQLAPPFAALWICSLCRAGAVPGAVHIRPT